MHGQVPEAIPKLLWLTLLTQMAEIIIYCTDQTLTFIIVRELCTMTHAETILNSVLWHVLGFFPKIPDPKRERVAENETIAVDVCNKRGHSVSCKMQRKSCKSHDETSNAENKATVYLIFTDMPARTHT